MSTAFATSQLCRPGTGGLRPGWVAFDAGNIVEVGHGAPPGEALDLGGLVLAPGYVDLQCNGVDADDFAEADAAVWQRIGKTLASHGVTSHCATLVSTDRDRYDAVLDIAAEICADAASATSRCLGVHLEGPFLGDAPGAHDPDLVSSVDLPWIEGLLARHPGVVRMVTLAPEADPDCAAIRLLVSEGVTVSLGHSRATYDVSRAAADAGASATTHLFNAMGTLHQREPGLAGAALDDERLTPTLIADLVHVHPALVRLAFARRPDLALVSDAVAVGGAVVARDGAAFLADGTLAGATVLLDGAVAAAARVGITASRAIESATSIPSGIVDAHDRGRLEPGARADLVALDPETMEVQRVWVGGEEIGVRQ